MFDASSVIACAQAEIGTREDPPNSNQVKYNVEYYGKNTGAPWCCAFVWWCFKESGQSSYFYGGGKTALCSTLMSYAIKKSCFVKKDFQPGDVVFFDSKSNGVAHHVGIVTSVSGSQVNTIEGNTSDKGSQDNGGIVMQKQRSAGSTSFRILGAYRPSGAPKEPDEPKKTPNTLPVTPPIAPVTGAGGAGGGTGAGSPAFGTYSSYGDQVGTIAELSTQPMMTFVEIIIGEQKLTLTPPNILVSFEFTRGGVGSSSNRFTLVLFDEKWDYFESLFSKYFADVQIKYGFVGGKKSKTYRCQLLTYSISFTTAGTLITVEGMSTSVMDNLTNVFIDTGTKNPTEAVKAIAKYCGWQISEANFDPSKDLPDAQTNIVVQNERPVTFILDFLAPRAVRASDERSGYVFKLDDTQTPPVAYFKIYDLQGDTQKTYIYMRGKDSPIIDLQLSINGVYGGFGEGDGITTGYNATVIDPETKKLSELYEDINSKRVQATGQYSHTKSTQYSAIVDPAGRKAEELRAILNFHVAAQVTIFSYPYRGTMTLIGDPTLEPISANGSLIRLIIVDSYGYMHHSSGLYQVNAVTDTINNGIMTSTIDIFRSEDIEEGIELVEYRALVK